MTRNLKVLHVEDTERDVMLLTRHITSAGYKVISERVDTPEGMSAALHTKGWDVILCDYSMPHFNALGALELLQRSGLDIPLIIISGTIGEETAVGAMRAGANDYLLKDKLARLVPAIEREMHEAQNRRAHRQAQQQIRLQAAALQSAANAILITDNQGMISWVNAAFTELTGYTLDEVSGRNPRILKSGKHESAFYETLWDTILSGQVWQGEMINRRKDGSHYFEEQTITPVMDETGEIINFIAIKQDVTERKRAEEALRISEERFRSYFELGLIGVSITTPGKGIIDVNDQLCETLGYEREELLQKNWAELTYPDDLAPDVAQFNRVLAGEIDGYSIDKRWIRKDGRIIYTTISVKCVRLADGTVDYFVALLQDITQRKLAEQEQSRLYAEVESQRRRLNNIVASVPGVVWEAWGEPDAATQRINFVSDYVETMLGYTVEEWLATPNFWLSIVHPDDQEEVGRDAAESFASGKPGHNEFRWLRKDGRPVWVESNFIVVKNDGGRPVGLRGVTIDITERKRAEEAVKQAERKYRSIFENAVEGIFQSSVDGKFISVNPAMAHILGHDSPEQVITERTNLSTQHYVDPNSRAELEKMLAEQDVVAGFECEVYRQDGSKIWTIENIRAIRDEAGVVLHYEGSLEDITERKGLEVQLQQSQKLEAIGILAGGIAHDFNNLLTVISGYSDLALMRLRPEEPLHKSISEILKAADRAAGLTRQLLAFSRKQVLQPRVLDLNSVVSEVEKMLRRLIGEDIEIRTILGRELGSVKADPGQIEQVLMNLAVNARDAMPHGGKLTIETENVFLDEDYVGKHVAMKPGAHVMLALTDTGTGMDEKTRERLFEPFFTTKGLGKGTGLGLSTVYGIVKQSGGNIWVYSEVGRGTTFKVYLPRVDEGAPEYTRGLRAQVPGRGAETILVAEDEEMVRKLAREVLETYGYKVLEAANGGMALLICERNEGVIDLLVTDVVMPEMSGRELADRLNSLRPNMKVLYMSGYTDNSIVHQGVLDQDANFIQKPFPPNALALKVREVLDRPD